MVAGTWRAGPSCIAPTVANLLVTAAKSENAPTTPALAASLCQSCHGAHGEGSPGAAIPRLAGQSAAYLEKQLKDYAAGTRDNTIMSQFAKRLSSPELASLAAYYASLNSPILPAARGGTASAQSRGHLLAHLADESHRVEACDNCHGPDGNGATRTAPYLAGQSSQYLTAALNAWKQGTRKNDDGKLMQSVVDRLDANDIAAIAAYFSNLD
jgi:cytochrome c553